MSAVIAACKSGFHVFKRASFSSSATSQLPFKVGHPLPDTTVHENTPQGAIRIGEVFNGKKGILFSVVGAFTPGCSQAHVPEFIQNYEKFQAEGYEVIACISVNDAYVMSAWGKEVDPEGKIRMLADFKGEFTKAVDMELNCSTMLGNIRSKRYSVLIDHNTIKHVSRDPDTSGLACLLCIRKMKPRDRHEVPVTQP